MGGWPAESVSWASVAVDNGPFPAPIPCVEGSCQCLTVPGPVALKALAVAALCSGARPGGADAAGGAEHRRAARPASSRTATATTTTDGASGDDSRARARPWPRRWPATARPPSTRPTASYFWPSFPRERPGPQSVPSGSRRRPRAGHARRELVGRADAVLAGADALRPGPGVAEGPSAAGPEVGRFVQWRRPGPERHDGRLRVHGPVDGTAPVARVGGGGGVRRAVSVRLSGSTPWSIWTDPAPGRTTPPGKRIHVTVAQGCPASVAGVVGVANPGAGLTASLLPAGSPTAALVCRYNGSDGPSGSLPASQWQKLAHQARLTASGRRRAGPGGGRRPHQPHDRAGWRAFAPAAAMPDGRRRGGPGRLLVPGPARRRPVGAAQRVRRRGERLHPGRRARASPPG